MAIYAIGDVQGCYDPLLRLLEKTRFHPDNDTLWLTGDLVSRGPHSLATLRFVRGLGDSAVTVLGNHDLHLLALAERPSRSLLRKRSDLNAILEAPDAGELLHWVRHRPLLHYDETLDKVLVHAGILPQWSIKKARKRAAEVEAVLQSNQHHDLLHKLYGDKPALWHGDLSGVTRWRFIINVFTRMRMLSRKGGLDLRTKGSPSSAPAHSDPWFSVPHKRQQTEVIFGHWSAIGFFRDHGVLSLDSGCVWGRCLTAVQLDDASASPIQLDCSSLSK